MSVRIQTPTTSLLVEAIESCATDALGGGAIFAFATQEGVSRFFEIPALKTLLEDGRPFTVIVGTDAITNAKTILEIEKVAAKYPTLQAFAHVHDSAVTFHPKFCWFDHQQSRVMIVGSGNLTSRGLGGQKGPPSRLGNWEAFLEQEFFGDDRSAVERNIDTWLREGIEANTLLPLSDERVLDAAVANSQISYVSPKPLRKSTPAKAVAGRVTRRTAPNDLAPIWLKSESVLIREIPLNRTGQADLGKSGLAFFGFSEQPIKILIQHVTESGEIGEAVERNLFRNASQNYRIELPEAAVHTAIGKKDERTILVAVKFDDGAYRYTLIPVTSENYRYLDQALGFIPGGRRLMRKKQTNFRDLREKWPTAPDALFPIVAISVDSTG